MVDKIKEVLADIKKHSDVHVLWTQPLIEVIDEGIWINDHLVYKNGEFFDVNGNHHGS